MPNLITPSQSARNEKKNYNLCNFEELPLLNEKRFCFDILVGNMMENEIYSGF